jgi:hypothetical protein
MRRVVIAVQIAAPARAARGSTRECSAAWSTSATSASTAALARQRAGERVVDLRRGD